VAAVAVDSGNNLGEFFLLDRAVDGIDAVGGRTPSKIFLVVNIRPREELVISVVDVLVDEEFQTSRTNNVVAAFAGAADTCSLSLVLDLLREVLAVAVDAEAVVALHGKGLHAWRVVTADFAHEAILDLESGRTGHVLTQTGFVENLVLLVHVLLNQTLLVPPHIPHEDGCGLVGLAEDVGDFFYLTILLGLDVLRAVDGEVDFVGLFARLKVLVLGVEADVEVGVCDVLWSAWGVWDGKQESCSDVPAAKSATLLSSSSSSSKSMSLTEAMLLKSSSESMAVTEPLRVWGVAGSWSDEAATVGLSTDATTGSSCLAGRESWVTEAAGDWSGECVCLGCLTAAASDDSSLRLRVTGGVVAMCGDETVALAVG
jgi:hypothetical protein